MMHAMARCLAAALLCSGVAVTIGGCGSRNAIQVAPTEGVVLLDGKPMAGVSVVFRQTGLSMVASDKTDAEGRFQLSTYGDFDGAPVGECVATVAAIAMDLTTVDQEIPFPDNSSIADPDERAAANRAAKGEHMKKLMQIVAERQRKNPPVKIPLRYSNPETSNLKFTILPSVKNNIQITLTN
jgi:hypothetical protein